jgi:hypothetical protein
VLEGVGQRMNQFVDGSQKFPATEHIEHFKVDAAGKRESRQTRNFDYVVSVAQAPNGVFELDEFRNGGVDRSLFPAGIATEGLPAMALLLHPTLAPDFDFKCEGLEFWEGRPAWRIRFEQRTDRPNRMRDYVVKNGRGQRERRGSSRGIPGFRHFRAQRPFRLRPRRRISDGGKHAGSDR